jgi:hypothetical protein
MHDYRMPQGGATRLPTRAAEPNYKITSNRGWIILAILMLAGLGAGVLIAMQSS